jgi:hypothetical protein
MAVSISLRIHGELRDKRIVAAETSVAYCAECDPGKDDLQDVPNSDEGTEGAHLPQETQVEVPEVQSD